VESVNQNYNTDEKQMGKLEAKLQELSVEQLEQLNEE
jgi:hypothetical protein